MRLTRAHRFLVVVLGLAAASAAALVIVVAVGAGGRPQLEGALVGLTFGGIGIALLVWSRGVVGGEVTTQARSPDHRGGAADALAGEAGGGLPRRRLVVRLVAGAAAAAGLVLIPLAWLGPRPGRRLHQTAWQPGLRVVDAGGRPVAVEDLAVGGFASVFPEGHLDAADAQAVLVRLPPRRSVVEPGRAEWAPAGYVAYSKLCTHMGCPLGLYEQETNVLLCPCHQSVFDVLRGGEPRFGPATRPLPQLPLGVDDEGFLYALDDFPAVVGPGFWRRPS